MKYFDTGDRDPQNSLAHWLTTILNDEVNEVRIQTGFFSIGGIGLFVQTLDRCRQSEYPVRILLGSNDMGTLRDDVAQLAVIMGIPVCDTAQLGVVSFSGAYFHPKTYHFRRIDGSQAAFVGSANLTASGLALHVEAGIALDTREGDDPHHLEQIAVAIDSWFTDERDGMTLIAGNHDIDGLVENGILALVPPPRVNTQNGNGSTGQRTPRPRLRPMITLPQVNRNDQHEEGGDETIQTSLGSEVTGLTAVPRNGFPQYLLFEPNAAGPTMDASALSGAFLPGGAAGLIIKLNNDSARHFMGRDGTANISIPVATVSTLRFGIRGRKSRPAGMFILQMRYIDDDVLIVGESNRTSLMGYGFTVEESGHGDIRLVVPTPAARSLSREIENDGHVKPTTGDLALLEWPTPQDPSFRITFLGSQSQLSIQANTEYSNAVTAEELVGKGACWLKNGLSPGW